MPSTARALPAPTPPARDADGWPGAPNEPESSCTEAELTGVTT